MIYNWVEKERIDAGRVKEFTKALFRDKANEGYEVVCELLMNRGVENVGEAREFFSPEVGDLHDPFLMKGMREAVERIVLAIERGERVMVHGDYDVDGTTAVSLLYSFLREIDVDVYYYTPDRYTEGYGFSMKGVDFAVQENIGLIITVDCGIKDQRTVSYARSKGVYVIVTDHHMPEEEMEGCVAVLNPKQRYCGYPFKELCGCGISFKIVCGLCERLGIGMEEAYKYLYLVALATCADIVPMRGENRVLTMLGMRQMEQNRPRCFENFLEYDKGVNCRDLLFGLAPKINAAGRIAHSRMAVELMISEDGMEVERLAKEIGMLNARRKELDSETLQEAVEQIIEGRGESKNSCVVFDKDWSKGVIGIVAAKLVETYYKPTVVFTQEGDKISGSARSVGNFDLYKALGDCKEYLTQYGGHKHAAGVTTTAEMLPLFKDKFEEVVSKNMKEEERIPVIDVDLEVKISDINDKLALVLNRFEPYGPESLQAVFMAKNLKVKKVKEFGSGNGYFFSVLEEKSGVETECVGWDIKQKGKEIKEGDICDMVFHVNRGVKYGGEGYIQLIVKDIRVN